MRTYQFAQLPPSTSSVAAGVTFAVSAWFVAAAGMMIVDTPAPHVAVDTASHVTYAAPAVAISPEARLIIVVEGRRA